MQDQIQILSRAVERWMRQDGPTTRTPSALELEKVFDLGLNDEACSDSELEQAINHFLDYSPKTSRVEFFKLLYSGLNKEALLGDWITSLCNSTMHTFQVGPVATLMEIELIRQWNQLVGFEGGDGVMVSGGSQANMVGMMLARHRACPDYKAKGPAALHGKGRLIAYVSDQAHYSNQRAANTLGIGTDNLVAIESNQAGQICPEALADAVQQDLQNGDTPFYIGLTAGTTVVGAYDAVKPCSDIAREHNIWLHIDGAWGAPVLFSDKHKHLLSECRLADSFAWDAHKLMNVPITAAVILVKQAGMLRDTSAGGGGDYLFHNDVNAEYNLGERSLQCGRRADALKVWLSWKAIGNHGFASKIEHLQDLKQECVELIDDNQSLEMLAPAIYLNVLFRYLPRFANNMDVTEADLAKFNIQICQRIKEAGGPHVDYASYKGKTGIRLVLANDQTESKHVSDLLKLCETTAQQLEREIAR